MPVELLNKVDPGVEFQALKIFEEAFDRLRDGRSYSYTGCPGFVHVERDLWDELIEKHNTILKLRGEDPDASWREHIYRRGH